MSKQNGGGGAGRDGKKPSLRLVKGGETQKKRAGQEPHVPTDANRHIVMLGMAAGYTQEQIAKLIGIGATTLVKYYATEIETGALTVNLAIAGNIASIAKDKNHPKSITAAIWWTKARMGWSDKSAFPGSGEGDGDEDDIGDLEFTVKIGEAKGV